MIPRSGSSSCVHSHQGCLSYFESLVVLIFAATYEILSP
uniref:Uncharacterized protein n=1 Tax=Anguilla anguilla TaxID=7936 RepID=A0A0E9VQ30_ANGAN